MASVFVLENVSFVSFGLGWDLHAGSAVDLDASCVAFDANGRVVDSVYYANLEGLNGLVSHSGDDRDGLGSDDDEKIVVNLAHIPFEVAGFAVVVTSYSGESFATLKTAKLRVIDQNDRELVSFYAGSSNGQHTGLVMCTLFRNAPGNQSWVVRTWDKKGDGRTFSDMIPLCQQCLREDIASIRVDPRLRVPVARKGEYVSINPKLPFICIGLAWDAAPQRSPISGQITDIDLDASCVAFDAFGGHIKDDTVYFGHLQSSNGAIKHSGDNLTGEGDGDDEQILVALPSVPPDVFFLAFEVTVYNREFSFRNVKTAVCRMIDNNGYEIVRYPLAAFGEYNALVACILHRTHLGWRMVALGEPTQGNMYIDTVPFVSSRVQQIAAKLDIPSISNATIVHPVPPNLTFPRDRSGSSGSGSSSGCCIIL